MDHVSHFTDMFWLGYFFIHWFTWFDFPDQFPTNALEQFFVSRGWTGAVQHLKLSSI